MKILIIEDTASFRQVISAAVRTLGHSISEAVDGPGGMAAIEREKPDMVLLDVILPGGKDGYNIARTVRKTIPSAKMKIILITSKGGDADVKFGKMCGADEYIIKKADQDLGAMVVAAVKKLGG